MDRKWSRENVKDSMKLEHDLYKKDYKDARKEISKIERRLVGIKKEISSGKARRER